MTIDLRHCYKGDCFYRVVMNANLLLLDPLYKIFLKLMKGLLCRVKIKIKRNMF